jgi:hypothetical protein
MLTLEYLQHLAGDHVKISCFYSLASYDRDMSRLYWDLKNYLDQRFEGDAVRFEPHERLVFEHDDLDFWIDDTAVPFTLYNLQLILRELDISNFFVRLVTNLPDYDAYAERVAQRLVCDQPMPVISSSLMGSCLTPPRPWHRYEDYDMGYKNIAMQDQNIEWPFICQSRLRRFHRTYFMSRLHARQLQRSGYISYSNQGPILQQTRDADIEPAPCYFLTASPFTRSSPEIVIREPAHQSCVRAFGTVSQYRWPEHQPDPPEAVAASAYMSSPEMSSALIYVGLETAVNLPRPFITRVTLRPVVNQRPFVIFGSAGVLSMLRDLGFRTFHDFWDESYDLETDIEARAEKIMDVLEIWSARTPEQLQAAYQDMKPIIEHNHRHFFSKFQQQQSDHLRQGLR